MDGQPLNSNDIQQSLKLWSDSATSSDKSWEANNLHIDEINNLDNIQKSEWVDKTLIVLEELKKLLKRENKGRNYIFFLHFDLSDSSVDQMPHTISLDWIKENINDYTPPSFNCTTTEYFDSFYKKQLVKCKSEIPKSPGDLDVYYRTYFDDTENMFSRELYFFLSELIV